MNYLQDEYHYHQSKAVVANAPATTWQRTDEEPKKTSLLEIAANAQESSTQPREPMLSSDQFFLEKVIDSSTGLDLVKHQVGERELLRDRHLADIDEAISYCKYKIWEFRDFYTGGNRSVDQTRNGFSQQIFQLQHEKRAEELVAWKDQSMMLKDFVEAWTGYRGDLWTYSVLNPKNG
jgi:hypothetical protein